MPAEPASARRTLRLARHVCRERFARVAGAAALVFGLTAIIDTGVARLTDGRHSWTVVIFVAIATSAAATFGATFYAGLLDRLVGSHLEGRPDPSIAVVLRSLPYARLIAADAVLTAIVLIASLAFLIPGVIAYTLLALVGPLINLEDHGVIAAFRRSAALTRPRFWLVLLLVTVPVQLEHDIVGGIEAAVHNESLVIVFLANAIVGALVGSVVGLVEVVLTFELVRADQAA